MGTSQLTVVELELDASRYAIELDSVVEVAPRVRIAPLPGAPHGVVGALRYRGEVLVAIDLRVRLGHPSRASSIDDHLVIVRTSRRRVALLVDRIVGLRSVSLGSIAPPPVQLAHLRGVVALDDGILLLQDVEAVLSLDEHTQLDGVMGTA